MSAEIIQLKPNTKERIRSMLQKAEDYESIDCAKCIEIQKEAIKLLILEVNRSTRLAKAALEVLSRRGGKSF
jgi:replication-associated recombination protein RarA